MRLLDASAPVQLDGSVARFDDALAGVDVEYEMHAGTLKEELHVAGDRVPAVYRFSIETTVGLEFERRESGEFEFVDSDGDAVFVLEAPIMWAADQGPEAARPVPATIERDGDAIQLVLRPDPDWLAEQAAAGGVVIDPTIGTQTFVAPSVCSFDNKPSVRARCPEVGRVGWIQGREHRTLLRWEMPEVLRGARITSSALLVDSNSTAAPTGTYVAEQVNEPWGNCADWSYRQRPDEDESICIFEDPDYGARFWGTAGGDVVASSGVAVATSPTGASADLTAMTQAWIDSPARNNGLLLRPTSGSGSLTFNAYTNDAAIEPRLVIRYAPDLGEPVGRELRSTNLGDRLTLTHDVGLGNALLEARDLSVMSRGRDFHFTRTYNSMSRRIGAFGLGTIGNLGLDQRIVQVVPGAPVSSAIVSFTNASGRELRFQPQDYDSRTGTTPYTALMADYSGVLTRRQDDDTWTLVEENGDRSTFDSGGYLTRVADKDGNATRILYGTSPKRPVSLVDTQGRAYDLTYDADGLIATIEDTTGRIHRYAYATDGSKRLLSATDPAGGVTTFGWDGTTCINRVVTPAGRITRLSCDAEGRLTRIVEVTDTGTETGHATSIAYSESSWCFVCAGTSSITDPRNRTWIYLAGADHRPTSIRPPIGPVETRSYNRAGRVFLRYVGTSRWFKRFGTSPFNPTGTTDPMSVSTTIAYDTAHPNNPSSTLDELGTRISYSYADAPGTPTAGRLTTLSVAGLGAVSQYAYNAFGQLRSVTTGAGNPVVDYGYDNDGQLTSVTRPAPRGTETMTYDVLSRLRTSTDAQGRTRTVTYDALDRVLGETWSDGSSIRYEYDRDGLRTRRTVNDPQEGTRVTRWRYDAGGQVRLQIAADGALTEYEYDAAGNLTTLTDDGGTVSYGYDAAGRLATITAPGLDGQPQITQIGYDALGNRASVQTPNEVVAAHGFNAAGRPTSMSVSPAGGGAPLLTRGYTYDNPDPDAPQRTTTRVFGETNESGDATRYSYDDPLARLVGATMVDRANTPAGTLAYAYDLQGNMIRRTENGATTHFGVDGASQLVGTGSTPNAWTTLFGWDASGLLMSSSAGLELGYNAKRQTTTMRRAGSTGVTSVGYAGSDQTQPTSVGNAAIAYDELGAASRTTPEGTTFYTRTPTGEVIGERTPTRRLFPARDRQGSVLGVTDETGSLARKLRYDPYGRTTLDVGTAQSTYGYAGGELFSDGTLLRFGERFYSPSLGRWTQPDPLEQPDNPKEANPFSYAGGDPVNNVDPTGRCVWKVPCPGVVRDVIRAGRWVAKRVPAVCEIYRWVQTSWKWQVSQSANGRIVKKPVPVYEYVKASTSCFKWAFVWEW